MSKMMEYWVIVNPQGKWVMHFDCTPEGQSEAAKKVNKMNSPPDDVDGEPGGPYRYRKMSVIEKDALEELGDPATPTCPECGTPFQRTLYPFDYEGEFFGYYPADVCENGHEYFTQESGQAIQEIAKVKGLGGRRRHEKTR